MATGTTDFTFGYTDTPGFREFAEVPNYAQRKVIYFSSPYRTTQQFYRGLVIVDRTASNTGSGTQTAIGLHIAPRTATGSGTGTGTANYIEILIRSATGSGQGTTAGTATGLHIAPRTASGSGLGTDVNTVIYVFISS